MRTKAMLHVPGHLAHETEVAMGPKSSPKPPLSDWIKHPIQSFEKRRDGKVKSQQDLANGSHGSPSVPVVSAARLLPAKSFTAPSSANEAPGGVASSSLQPVPNNATCFRSYAADSSAAASEIQAPETQAPAKASDSERSSGISLAENPSILDSSPAITTQSTPAALVSPVPASEPIPALTVQSMPPALAPAVPAAETVTAVAVPNTPRALVAAGSAADLVAGTASAADGAMSRQDPPASLPGVVAPSLWDKARTSIEAEPNKKYLEVLDKNFRDLDKNSRDLECNNDIAGNIKRTVEAKQAKRRAKNGVTQSTSRKALDKTVRFISSAEKLAMGLSRLDHHGIAPIVVGSVFAIVKILDNSSEQYLLAMNITADLAGIVALWNSVEKYQILKNENKVLGTSYQELGALIVDLYKVIIVLLGKVVDYQNQNKFCDFIDATISPVADWKALRENIRACETLCDKKKSQITILKEGQEKELKILKSISKYDLRVSFQEVLEHTGTDDIYSAQCQWLFNVTESVQADDEQPAKKYAEWQMPGNSSLLWVTGIKGTGKTTLMARATQEMKRSQMVAIEHMSLAFFFFRASSTASQTSTGLDTCLGSLVRQLAWNHSTDQLESLVGQKYKEFEVSHDGDSMLTAGECKQLLRSLVQNRETYIMIDAIDECDNWQSLVEALQELMPGRGTAEDGRQPLHLMLCGRNKVPFTNYAPHALTIVTNSTDSKEDINFYIETEIKRITEAQGEWKLVKSSKGYLEILEEKLKRMSFGVFRWTELQFVKFKKFIEEEDIDAALKQLEQHTREDDLDKEYKALLALLEDPPHRERALKLLRLIACSFDSLSVESLAEALNACGAKVRLDSAYVRRILAGFIDETRPIEPDLRPLLIDQIMAALVDEKLSEVPVPVVGVSGPGNRTQRRLSPNDHNLICEYLIPKIDWDSPGTYKERKLWLNSWFEGDPSKGSNLENFITRANSPSPSPWKRYLSKQRRVALAHSSVLEYLQSTPDDAGDFTILGQHSEAANFCFSQFNTLCARHPDIFESSEAHGTHTVPRKDLSIFLAYSWTRWPYHCQRALAEEGTASFVQDAQSFICGPGFKLWSVLNNSPHFKTLTDDYAAHAFHYHSKRPFHLMDIDTACGGYAEARPGFVIAVFDLQKLLECPEVLALINPEHRTRDINDSLLQVALMYGSRSMVSRLLALFPKMYDHGLLGYAADLGYVDVTERLLEFGDDTDAGFDSAVNGYLESGPPWHEASLPCIGRMLDHGANIYVINSKGQTAAHRAAHDNASQLLQLLIKHAKLLEKKGSVQRLIRFQDNDGQLPQHYAQESDAQYLADELKKAEQRDGQILYDFGQPDFPEFSTGQVDLNELRDYIWNCDHVVFRLPQLGVEFESKSELDPKLQDLAKRFRKWLETRRSDLDKEYKYAAPWVGFGLGFFWVGLSWVGFFLGWVGLTHWVRK